MTSLLRHRNDGNWIREIIPIAGRVITAIFRSVNHCHSARCYRYCVYIYITLTMPPTTIISGLMVGRLFSSKKVYFVVSMLIWGWEGFLHVFTIFMAIPKKIQKQNHTKTP
jgi:hypothetical protein